MLPVITLIGDATQHVTVSSTLPYTDPGASAVDASGTVISHLVEVSGQVVNRNVAGTYIITYNVTDTNGNSAVEVLRTVIVGGSSSSDPYISTML